SSQSQQLGAQIVGTLIIGDTKFNERIGNRSERAPLGGAVLPDQPRKGSRPQPALCGKWRAIQLQEAAMDAATPFGHRPLRKALIEIARQESNQRWMDPGIGVETVHHPNPVAMSDRSGGRNRRGL